MPDSKERARTQSINEFLTDCQKVSRQFEDVFTAAVRLVGYYSDNNYAEDLTVEDFAAYRFEKEDLEQFIVMLQQVMAMAQGQPPANLEYRHINNQIK